MTMSFRQLAHVGALAHHRNFKRAAAELHISQPALTRSLQTLESALGTKLFDRLSTGLELTPAGEVFLPMALRVVRDAGELEQAMGRFTGLSSGSLSISTGPYPGDRLVPEAVAGLMTLHPGIYCQVHETDWTEVAARLLERESDIAVADLSAVEGDDRFDTELLIDDPLYFICRRGHPLAGGDVVSPSDFDQYPLVGNRVPDRLAKHLGIGLNTASGAVVERGHFRIKIDITTFAATKRVVLATDSFTLAPLIQVEAELCSGDMTTVVTRGKKPRMNSGLIYLKGRALSPAALQFAQELRRIKLELDRRTASLASRFNLT
jgi:DNA-binding transcriptional LysR family regulator